MDRFVDSLFSKTHSPPYCTIVVFIFPLNLRMPLASRFVTNPKN